jgi:predicted NACHT family NTPase
VAEDIRHRRKSGYGADESYSYHPWKSLLRYHLASIERTNQFYGAHDPSQLGLIYEFEKVLRRQIHSAYSLITPPYARDRVQVSINDLYVLPGFRHLGAARSSPRGADLEQTESPTIGFEAVTQGLYRTVILGDPGAGKSTLLAKLAYDLSDESDENLSGLAARTPFVIVLRDYQQYRDSHNLGMVDYIRARANTKYHASPPEGAVEYLMLSGRVIILLDGLDELLHTDARQEISQEVASLGTRYPQTPIVITSRRVGYEEARLPPTTFQTFMLSDFDQKAIEEYVHKWFALPGFRTVEEQQATPRQFLAESQQVHDLRANPLMLGLLCNIYQGESYIPRSRPEVYEACSSMLFEKWDRRRGIIVKVPYRAQLEPALKHLAFWIYSEGLAGGVQHHRLIERTKS